MLTRTKQRKNILSIRIKILLTITFIIIENNNLIKQFRNAKTNQLDDN